MGNHNLKDADEDRLGKDPIILALRRSHVGKAPEPVPGRAEEVWADLLALKKKEEEGKKG